ncbi:hypothetical protein EAH75_06480 [Rhodanobacter glycinis]|uniref:hypothetical protein n=1 Tax=Rhodanobacter glycinis TaxID=582702 RepID=UPI001127EEE8|nr:hypothetical protein [Rhodanobacter glycinis]TPG51038.1 hypothetical protein EAH75_06480 [Rhodanobacter glycinis]
MRRVLLLLALLAITGPAPAQTYEIKTGFVTGQAYLQMTQPQRSAYAMGVVDGMFLSPFFGAPKVKVTWLETCVTGMPDSQLVAVLDQYVRANPVRWHESMHTLAFSALKQACPAVQPDT